MPNIPDDRIPNDRRIAGVFRRFRAKLGQYRDAYPNGTRRSVVADELLAEVDKAYDLLDLYRYEKDGRREGHTDEDDTDEEYED